MYELEFGGVLVMTLNGMSSIFTTIPLLSQILTIRQLHCQFSMSDNWTESVIVIRWELSYNDKLEAENGCTSNATTSLVKMPEATVRVDNSAARVAARLVSRMVFNFQLHPLHHQHKSDRRPRLLSLDCTTAQGAALASC